MDYFTLIVHVFAPHTREFYSLERLWGDAERIEMSDEPRRRARHVARSRHGLAMMLSALAPRRRPSGGAARTGVRSLRAPFSTRRAGLSAASAGTRIAASRRRSATGAAIRCPPGACISVGRCASARDAGAARRRSRRAAPSAPTTGRFARSCTRSSTGMPLAGARPGRAPARKRRRPPRARRHRGSRAAPPQPASGARLQSGARAGPAAGRARWSRHCAGSARRRRRPIFRPRRGTATCANAFALRAAAAAGERRGAADCARRRCEHDGRDDRGVRARAACGGRRRCQRGDGSPSRVSTARMTSAATSAFPRSPSSRTQSGAAACRR